MAGSHSMQYAHTICILHFGYELYALVISIFMLQITPLSLTHSVVCVSAVLPLLLLLPWLPPLSLCTLRKMFSWLFFGIYNSFPQENYVKFPHSPTKTRAIKSFSVQMWIFLIKLCCKHFLVCVFALRQTQRCLTIIIWTDTLLFVRVQVSRLVCSMSWHPNMCVTHFYVRKVTSYSYHCSTEHMPCSMQYAKTLLLRYIRKGVTRTTYEMLPQYSHYNLIIADMFISTKLLSS